MSNKIIVCLKQVPDTDRVEIDPERGTLKREGVDSIINPYDLHALEFALELKESASKEKVEIIAISMGPIQAQDILKEALALGVDKAYLISDSLFAGADTLATSRVLSESIKKFFPVSLILTGKQAIDGDTGQIGAQIASFLNLPFIPYLKDIAWDRKEGFRITSVIGRKKIKWLVKDPLVVSVERESNFPRKPTLLGWREVFCKKKVKIWNNQILKLEPQLLGLKGSPTRVKKVEVIGGGRSVKFLTGTPSQIARKLWEIISQRKDGKSSSCREIKVSILDEVKEWKKGIILLASDIDSSRELSLIGNLLLEKKKEKVPLLLLVVGKLSSSEKEQLFSLPINKIFYFHMPDKDKYFFKEIAFKLKDFFKSYQPQIIISLAQDWERALMPIISSLLETGLTADCTKIDFDENDEFLQIRPAWGGNLLATIITPFHFPKMATVRKGIYQGNFNLPSIKRKVNLDVIDEGIETQTSRVFLEGITEVKEENNLEKANFILSGGGGVGKEGFDYLKSISTILGAQLAGSRLAVEKGWIEKERQVGQTGKTVAPKIYLACGISGAVQHLVGIKNSELIIAINSDNRAPIFNFSDYGVVADYKIILKELEKIVKEELDGNN